MEYTIKLNAEELRTVGLALESQPFKMVASLITKLQTQITEQEAVANKPAQAVESTETAQGE